MNTQPEALRLAEQLDNEWPEDCEVHAAADELFRLHALNAELLEVLKEATRLLNVAFDSNDNPFGIEHNNAVDALSAANAAIAKAEAT